MKKIASLVYAFAGYALFFATILYAIGFVGNIAVPKSIDSGPPGPLAQAFLVDLALVAIFAVQHSVMARAWFKKWWTRFVPARVERSTYVVFSSLVLLLLFWQWQPLPTPVWEVKSTMGAGALQALFWIGWGIAFVSTYLIDHFELFGLRQVIAPLRATSPSPSAPVLRTPLLYRYVRHPLYTGFIVAFWLAPVMTIGHLLFSAAMTGYILVGIHFEERDLTRTFGEQYRRYQASVGMLVPRATANREDPAPQSQSGVV